MRAVGIFLALALAATGVLAQQPAGTPSAQTMKTFASSAEVTAMIAKAKAERKPDLPNYVQRILQLAPYNANLEYRMVIGPAAVHEKDAELFYVIEGSGTMVTGGKLTKESRTNANNLTGDGIEGGTSQDVAKGDFLIVPENTPHWVSKINGTLVMMSFHAPRSSAAH